MITVGILKRKKFLQIKIFNALENLIDRTQFYRLICWNDILIFGQSELIILWKNQNYSNLAMSFSAWNSVFEDKVFRSLRNDWCYSITGAIFLRNCGHFARISEPLAVQWFSPRFLIRPRMWEKFIIICSIAADILPRPTYPTVWFGLKLFKSCPYWLSSFCIITEWIPLQLCKLCIKVNTTFETVFWFFDCITPVCFCGVKRRVFFCCRFKMFGKKTMSCLNTK